MSLNPTQSFNTISQADLPPTRGTSPGDDVAEALARVSETLSSVVDYQDIRMDADAFNLTLARIFAADTPEYALSEGVFGASRSNWTYHTARAMNQTAKLFDYTCRFEAGGKRDAIFATCGDAPVPAIVAEWEWDYQDIFGSKKELEKLRDSCRLMGTAHALLLVYCPVGEVPEFLLRITEFWKKSFRRHADPPLLYIHVILFEPSGNIRQFVELSTIAVSRDSAWLMSSIAL